MLWVAGWALDTEAERGFPLVDEDATDFMANRRVDLCGWCILPGSRITNETELQGALRAAGRASLSTAAAKRRTPAA